MKIEYSKHLETRLDLRDMPHDLPRRIFGESRERYLDTETGNNIAVMHALLYGRDSEVMVAYVIDQDLVTLLTIHPLKEGQKDNRVRSGRWRGIS